MTAAGGGDRATRRFPIRFEPWYRLLSLSLGLPPSSAYVEVGVEDVVVRMGWAFRSRFPRSAVLSAAASDSRPLSKGVHGFGGRWLVNGSGRGIVRLEFEPPQRAYVSGLPVRLRELAVSVPDPADLIAALGR